MKLSLKQRELLARALRGEDREIESAVHSGDRLVAPARRWYVPRGFIVVYGSAEYSAARVLAARGLLKWSLIPRSKRLPYGNGGLKLTRKGREIAKGCV